jgi:hypothetical protein
MRPFPTPYALLGLAWWLAVNVQAQEAAQEGAGQPPLSRQSLKQCLVREMALQQRNDALARAKVEHRQLSIALSEEAQALSRQLRQLDSSDLDAVSAYNQRNERRNVQVEKNNQRAQALNAATDELKSTEADYLRDCTARTFMRTDEEALLRQLGWKRLPYDTGKGRLVNDSGGAD